MSRATNQLRFPGNSHDEPGLLIVGASARAAAFSALRAGITPCCVDRFADADLKARCRCVGLSSTAYRTALAARVQRLSACPWMYVGGIENRPRLIRTITHARPLWGNDHDVLSVVRSPTKLSRLLENAGLPCPAVRTRLSDVPAGQPWLSKPLASAGGAGVHWLSRKLVSRNFKGRYFQEYVPGDAYSAAYVGDGGRARLLGVTRQLIGEEWLHAQGFRYCGSIGPVSLPTATRRVLDRLGQTLSEVAGVRGLFGIDFILNGEMPWLVEVNPRYTASMEVIEFGNGVPMLALHRHAFEPTALFLTQKPRLDGYIGKAIYFAPQFLEFPRDGPWTENYGESRLGDLPEFADIPQPGHRINAQEPVFTLFSRGGSIADCFSALKAKVRDLDRKLVHH